MLDACRSAAPGEAAIGARSLKLISRDRAIFIDGKDSIGNGLAAIEAQRNTFIGFAAAPGGVAYDGDQALSPFTGALVKYLGSVDLPLSNLTSRVRQEVLISTQGRQHTWDQSSLMEPFFFNPGT
ncbi:caspase family protein, partial [Mesorhizobium sp. BHbdii]